MQWNIAGVLINSKHDGLSVKANKKINLLLALEGINDENSCNNCNLK